MQKINSVKDLAELTGVSPMTVSRVFSGKQPVAASTRERVLATAARYGYRPNVLARSLRDGRSHCIGVLWSLGVQHEVGHVIRNLTLRLHGDGYLAYVGDHLGMVQILQRTLEDYLARRVDGIILQWDAGLPREIVELLNRFEAVVIVTKHPAKLPQELRADVVHHDTRSALRELALHLMTTGRRRPAFLVSVASNRFKADEVMEQLGSLDHPAGRDPIIDVPAGGANGAVEGLAGELLSEACREGIWFDALVCGTDTLAFAGAAWLRSRGLEIPGDVALYGYNNITAAAYFHPPLASIERCDGLAVEAAWAVMQERVERPDAAPQTRVVEHCFVWRESAGERRD